MDAELKKETIPLRECSLISTLHVLITLGWGGAELATGCSYGAERETKIDRKNISPDCTVQWMTAADRRREKAGQDFPLSEKQQIHKSKLITQCAICSVCDLLSLSKGFDASVRCSFCCPLL